MKYFFTFLLIAFFSGFSFAQDAKFNQAIDDFFKNYNQGNYELIFNEYTNEVKEQLNKENTLRFFVNLDTYYGKVKDYHLAEYSDNQAIYTANFDKEVFNVIIALDSNYKILGFEIKIKEKEVKPVINALTNYPTPIADLLFNSAKDLPNNVQFSVAIVKDGTTNFYGLLKHNDTVKAIDNKLSVFEIGSITKVFTNVILSNLVLEGKVKLTDKVNKYFPFTFNNSTELTFKDLSNHTSGLPQMPSNFDLKDLTNPYITYTQEHLNSYLKSELKLDKQPSEGYLYSNLGSAILANTITKIEKNKLQNSFQRRIFDKYKMTSSFTHSSQVSKNLVKGINDNSQEVSNWDYDVFFGAGGIYSTTQDLSKFAIAQFDITNKDLYLTHQHSYTINTNMSIALGWHLLNFKGKPILWHNGGTGGYTSSMSVDVIDKTAVIILSNLSAYSSKMQAIDRLCLDLIKHLNQ